jgi:decaprenylphospho-beta-D-ribofuranose 2-oxidase
MNRQRLSGWGRTAIATCDVMTPTTPEEVVDLFQTGSVMSPRGLGRSYGDAAQLSGGIVLDNSGFGDIGPIDSQGVVTVGAGVSIDQLLTDAIPQGWFVPVTPGTRQVTMAGAVAADVHGKNHHVDGSFTNHVLAMTLVTPTGIRQVTPDNDPELFWATAGGMGLTGVITSVTLRMLAITTDQVSVDTERFHNIDDVMAEMLARDHAYRYSVAWVDCMTSGRRMGRAILTRGDHVSAGETTAAQLRAPRPPRLTIPFDAPTGLLNPLTIKLFNEAWYRHAPARRDGELQSLSTFFHPLDGVKDWNRLYGRRGFVQYQFCVDDAHGDTIVSAISKLSSSGVPSFLAVLKRFGAATPSPLSFPVPGWTLALDLPVGPAALPRVLDELDELVLSAGGRIYFAKDSRLDPSKVAAMYPRLHEFVTIKNRVDPQNQLTSDLARRLHLVGS